MNKPTTPKRKKPRKPCENCKGDGWFTTDSGTVMCSACRGKGHK
jgi:DnaJ-class molecular chaperone